MGFGDPAIVEACRRAQAIARSLEMPLAVFLTTAGLMFLHLMRAELDEAAAQADELVTVAPSLSLPECTAAADAAIAVVLYSRGDLIGARRCPSGRRCRARRRDGLSECRL